MEGFKLTKKEYKRLKDRFDEQSEFIKRATVDTIKQESAKEQQQRVEILLKPENYALLFDYYFCKETYLPLADCACAWYHSEIYKDLFTNSFLTLFNLIFRGGAKSTHANLGYIFGLKQNELAKFFLVVGQTEPRAAMLLQDLQVQFEFNKRIIKDFGTQKVYGTWADGMFETTDRCSFLALGVDQPFRGLRANGVRLEYASIDDIEDLKTAKNKELIDERAGKVTGDIQGAFSTRSERTIINNNYVVKKGFIETLAEKKGVKLKEIDTKKTQVITPNEYTKVYIVNLTNKYFEDIEGGDTNWSPEWEERFTRAACLRKIAQYEHDKAVLSGEFYNTPVRKGKRITEEMIKMVKPLPLEEYDMIIENWDLAYSDKACYKAKGCIGIKGNRMTVLDVFNRQTSVPIAMRYHFDKAKFLFNKNQAYMPFYDASVSQEAVYAPEWNKMAIRCKSFHIPLPQHSTIEKFTKIDAVLVGALTNGVLDFSQELEHNPDWEDAKEHMLSFEKGCSTPVDYPDALTDAIIQAAELMYDEDEENEDNLLNNPVIGKKKRGTY